MIARNAQSPLRHAAICSSQTTRGDTVAAAAMRKIARDGSTPEQQLAMRAAIFTVVCNLPALPE
jgi:hypothetical protein